MWGHGVGIVAFFTLAFLMLYVFNLSASPFFMMLLSAASFGYLLWLLSNGPECSKIRKIIYRVTAVILIALAILLAAGTPHSRGIFV